MHFCTRCGCKVDEETELDYPWYCPNCDENMFNVETDPVEELDVEGILYGLYLHDWIATHDEGDPVCFDEFVDNEFMEKEIVSDLLTSYGLQHLLREYDDVMDTYRYFAEM